MWSEVKLTQENGWKQVCGCRQHGRRMCFPVLLRYVARRETNSGDALELGRRRRHFVMCGSPYNNADRRKTLAAGSSVGWQWTGSGVVVVFANLTELFACLGEESWTPWCWPGRSRPCRRRCCCDSGGRPRLGFEMWLFAANTVADHDARSKLVEVRLQLFFHAAPQHINHVRYSIHSVTAALWQTINLWHRGGSPTAVQAWRTCPLWEPSPSHPILVWTRGLVVL